MNANCIEEIPGAAALRDWYGVFPGFHDGYLQFQISQDGSGWMKLFGWRMTDQRDENGYIVCDKYFGADLFLENIVSPSMQDFLPGAVILGWFEIRKQGDIFEVDFTDTAYGASGLVCAKNLCLEFEPGKRISK